ncbi:LysR family transcriptional regulator [Paraburkholderia phenazinium]|uniref:LysR family transcriptional regulator n=1 Tax=Paraburkholderia phenazinium TaxID=60549 RepID=UPI00158D3D4B|nr:LysR family transcriptional regulator [Paraburkholderia phenazinium]
MSVLRPSLNALRAFEVSVRLGSMTLAANELGVTPGAVSRHIQSLETIFSITLLKRLGQSVEPTSEGRRLAVSLSEGFQLINASVQQLQPGPLTVSCSATIMMYWLIPRLARFKQAYPDVEVLLNVNYGPLDLAREEVSVAIRNDMLAPPQDVIVKHLMKEETGLVCAPGFFEKHGQRGLDDLLKMRILATKTRPRAWRDWLARVGRQDLDVMPHDVYEHFYLMIQAASCGLGVAIAPRMMVEEEIGSGRLVAPYGFEEGEYNIVLWIAPSLRSSKDLQALVAWLRKEGASDTAPVDGTDSH